MNALIEAVKRYYLEPPYGQPERWPQAWTWIGEHIFLTVVAMGIAVALAVPAGMWLTRKPRLAGPVIGFFGMIQTVPSLAMIGFVVVLVGVCKVYLPFKISTLGPVPSIIALVLYALLPILVNTYTGIRQVSPPVLEAARAMGMTGAQVLGHVELPLALPVIMAGIRTATVWTVGIATICGLVGAGGLGEPIFQGLRTYDNTLILMAVAPASLLALGLSGLLTLAERGLTPRGLKILKV